MTALDWLWLFTILVLDFFGLVSYFFSELLKKIQALIDVELPQY